MIKNNPIALLPLDDRPVSYLLPKQIADFAGIDLILPDRKYLGNLSHASDLEYIENWCKGLINQAPTLVIALDNWVYGGLVQSRKHHLATNELKKRVEMLRAMSLQNVHAFSSIMRIPNYNSSEEEKEYWEIYGDKIFKWSELLHKVGRGIKDDSCTHEELIENWYQSSKVIPSDIIADYKSHRDKNLTINFLWLESLHDCLFKYIIFSCDDSSKYGMNVVEAEYLKREIIKHNFSNKARILSGTDEIPLVLLTKYLLNEYKIKPSVSLFFDSDSGKDQLGRYESHSIYEILINLTEVLDLEIKDIDKSDIILCVHNADSIQGDHVFQIRLESTRNNAIKTFNLIQNCNKPFILIDLAYANGADPELMEILIDSKVNWDKCYGYSGWNTCSNSIGSALAIGINRWLSEKNKTFNEEFFKKCLLVRFLDDYAYQAKIRHKKVTESEINEKIKPYAEKFSIILGLNDIKVQCKLPWKRSFEVEIEL